MVKVFLVLYKNRAGAVFWLGGIEDPGRSSMNARVEPVIRTDGRDEQYGTRFSCATLPVREILVPFLVARWRIVQDIVAFPHGIGVGPSSELDERRAGRVRKTRPP